MPFITDGALIIAALPPPAPFKTSLAIARWVSSSYLLLLGCSGMRHRRHGDGIVWHAPGGKAKCGVRPCVVHYAAAICDVFRTHTYYYCTSCTALDQSCVGFLMSAPSITRSV